MYILSYFSSTWFTYSERCAEVSHCACSYISFILYFSHLLLYIFFPPGHPVHRGLWLLFLYDKLEIPWTNLWNILLAIFIFFQFEFHLSDAIIIYIC